MSDLERLHNFKYNYLRGPVSYEDLQTEIVEGNCRLAVQDYFYINHDLYLGRKDLILSKEMVNGFDVIKNQDNIGDFFSRLKEGDIVYADNLRNSFGNELKPRSEKFPNEEERLLNLHLGVYLDRLNQPTIWHSSFISKGTVLWSIDEFCYYYKPFIARRIINQNES
ncbi:MAG: hypothetical protein WCT51_02900 [Candidatus Shapirobacteria bacterium]|jgi:hypothetical protein